MIKPTSRKTMASNTKNKEVCDRHARHRLGTYRMCAGDVTGLRGSKFSSVYNFPAQ